MDPLVPSSLIQDPPVEVSESKEDLDEFELDATFFDPNRSQDGDASSAMDIDPPDANDQATVALHRALSMLGSGPDRDRIYKIQMAFWFQASTNGSGIQLTYANNLPSASPAWSAAAGLFNQYRVKETCVKLIPMYNVNFTGVVAQSMMSYIDEDDPTTAPGAYADALKHADTLRVDSGYDVVVRKFKQLGRQTAAPDTTWLDTAFPAATAAIKFVGNHSLISTVTHNVVVEWEVEFRVLGA
jgi:hypothetical protein